MTNSKDASDRRLISTKWNKYKFKNAIDFEEKFLGWTIIQSDGNSERVAGVMIGRADDGQIVYLGEKLGDSELLEEL